MNATSNVASWTTKVNKMARPDEFQRFHLDRRRPLGDVTNVKKLALLNSTSKKRREKRSSLHRSLTGRQNMIVPGKNVTEDKQHMIPKDKRGRTQGSEGGQASTSIFDLKFAFKHPPLPNQGASPHLPQGESPQLQLAASLVDYNSVVSHSNALVRSYAGWHRLRLHSSGIDGPGVSKRMKTALDSDVPCAGPEHPEAKVVEVAAVAHISPLLTAIETLCGRQILLMNGNAVPVKCGCIVNLGKHRNYAIGGDTEVYFTWQLAEASA